MAREQAKLAQALLNSGEFIAARKQAELASSTVQLFDPPGSPCLTELAAVLEVCSAQLNSGATEFKELLGQAATLELD